MSSLRDNIVANYAGNIWQSLMAVVLVPVYIHFMGAESYGLIGIFTSLQAILIILDMGIGATLTREMARLSVLPGKVTEMANLARSLEVICWCMAVLVGAVVFFAAPFITSGWLKPDRLSQDTVMNSVRFMSLAIALQWPSSLYSGGLMGLQRQVLVNILNVILSTLRGIGGVIVLWLISPTICAFLLWQAIVSGSGTVLLAFYLWRNLPVDARRASFKKETLRNIWQFAAGISGITILSVLLVQADKIILSRMLSLEMFGYYTLAGTVAMSLGRLTYPVNAAIFPRITELVSAVDLEGLKQLYHKSCQMVAVLVLPLGTIIAMFSYEIMCLWTQNPTTADRSFLLVAFLVCGSALNGLMNIPYVLQLAYGWTKLTLLVNLAAAALLLPMIVLLTRKYGAVGGASVWAILNGLYILVVIHLMHKRLLISEKWRWYWQDVSIPLAASLVVAGSCRLMFKGSQGRLATFLCLVVISAATLGAAAVLTPVTRTWLMERFSTFRLRLLNGSSA